MEVRAILDKHDILLPNTKEKKDSTTTHFDQFIQAVIKDNTEQVIQQLEAKDKNFDINQKDKNGFTALMYAAASDQKNLVRLLLDRKADIYATSADGIPVSNFFPLTDTTPSTDPKTTLQTNAFLQRLLRDADPSEKKILSMLAAHGADNEKVFEYAMKNKIIMEPAVLLSILFGISERSLSSAIKLRFKDGRTPLMIAAAGCHQTYVNHLRLGIDFNAKDDLGKTALMYAAEHGYPALKTLLFKLEFNSLLGENRETRIEKVDINASSNNGMTALMYAAICAGKKEHGIYFANENVEHLLKAGANTNQLDAKNKNALLHALENGISTWVVKLLASPKEVLNAQDQGDKSVIIMCIQHSDIHTFNMLFSLCPTKLINQPDHNGKTPLMYAAERGESAMIRELLLRNADSKKLDKNNCSARDYLDKKHSKYSELSKLLPQTSLSSTQFQSQTDEHKSTPALSGFLTSLFKTKKPDTTDSELKRPFLS